MMQPPITVGTVLQNRYRIIQILGQGDLAELIWQKTKGDLMNFVRSRN